LELPLVSCNNNVVSLAEYDAVVAYADSLDAQNDSLHFELQDPKLYNDYLEKTIDSLQHGSVSDKDFSYAEGYVVCPCGMSANTLKKKIVVSNTVETN